jgi:hypothetical protein
LFFPYPPRRGAIDAFALRAAELSHHERDKVAVEDDTDRRLSAECVPWM